MFLVFEVVQVLMIHFYCVFSKGILIILYIIYDELQSCPLPVGISLRKLYFWEIEGVT